jgi:hypothetical protein
MKQPVRKQTREEIVALLERARVRGHSIALDVRFGSGLTVCGRVVGVDRRWVEVCEGVRVRHVGLSLCVGVRVVPPRQDRELKPLDGLAGLQEER